MSPLKTPFLTPLRVLLAEDHEVNRLVACEMIRRLGCHVEIAGDGFEALAALEQSQYDVVLMDVQMPGMDGLAATRELRRREAHQRRRTPVIAMTANAMIGDQERCLDAGMDAYLAKPVRPRLLREALQRWCSPEPPPPLVSPPAEGNAIFDAELLHDCCGNDPLVVAEVLDSFLRSVPDSLKTILASIEADDAQELERRAHRFKGACQTLGARAMVTACTRLLAMARKNDLSHSHMAYDDLQNQWEYLKVEVLAHRETLPLDS